MGGGGFLQENIHPWQIQHSEWTTTDTKHQRTLDNILTDHNVFKEIFLSQKIWSIWTDYNWFKRWILHGLQRNNLSRG